MAQPRVETDVQDLPRDLWRPAADDPRRADWDRIRAQHTAQGYTEWEARRHAAEESKPS